MQPYRITTRTVPRVCKHAACSPSTYLTPSPRTMFTTPFFHPASEFGPLFRLLDSAAADLIPSGRSNSNVPRTFTPRFDVREADNNYELQGELPGLQQRDLQIEFVDERTLVIRGRSERESSESNVDNTASTPAAEEKTAEGAEATAIHDAASDKSGNYRKASVEDEYVDAGAEASSSDNPAPAADSNKNAETDVAVPAAENTSAAKAEPALKYWVSERSVGEFERRFAFPGRVDQEAVTASLKNGILSVVVPKIVERQARKIEIN